MPGVSFAGTWEIGTSSTVVCEFRSATSLASVGELGVRASSVDVDALGGRASLEDGWKIWSETPLADVCRIGIETSLVGDGGLGAGTSIADVWRIGVETSLACVLRIGAATSLVGVGGLVAGTSPRDIWSIGAAMSLKGSWGGTETPAAWHVFGTDGSTPFSTDTDDPDNAKTGFGICIKHIGSRCKSASTSSTLSPSKSVF